MRKIKPKTEKVLEAEAPSRKIYPSFSIELEYLPEAKKWKVGETYYIGLKMKMKGLTIDETVKNNYSRATFDITGIEILKRPKKQLIKRYD